MINRIYQFTVAFFLLFSSFSASGKEKIHYNHPTKNKNASFSTASDYHHPINYDFSINNVPVQLINVQQHRGSHSPQALYHSPIFLSVAIKYVTFVCGSGSSELSRFRKLILFPFHAFW